MDLIYSTFIRRLELINTIIFGLSGPMANFIPTLLLGDLN